MRAAAMAILGLLFVLLISVTPVASFVDVEIFDYVIIGGGAAGSAMAARLSENAARTVVVLHRGTDQVCDTCDNTTSSNPGNLNNAGLYSDFGADYFSSPQLFTQRNIREVRSNLPGGATRIYGAISVPSSQSLIDSKWPAGLKYNVMRPYLNKPQDHFCNYFPQSVTNISAAECATYHGVKGGPMSISPPTPGPDYDIAKDLFAASSKAGIRAVPDPYNPNYQSGSYVFPTHFFHNRAVPNDITSRRTRESTWTGYLPLSTRQARKNLEFRTRAEGREFIYAADLRSFPGIGALLGITFGSNSATPRIVGVKYEQYGEMKYVFAKRQVVLSAGVEGTPHLLQANGIGPADLLTKMGVPVVADNPAVGQNVAAHQAVAMTFAAKTGIPIQQNNQAQLAQMILSSPLNQGFPDIEVELLLGYAVRSADTAVTGVDPIYFTTAPINGAYPFGAVLVTVCNPEWRGSINITNKRFQDKTIVDYGWPSDATAYATSPDYQKLTWGFGKMRELFLGNNSFAEKWFGNGELIPGSPAGDFFHSAQYQNELYHLTGGMNIGTATDLKGAVKGVKGLTVCDDSLLPHPPNANPVATTLALCEYVADQIKATY